MRALPAAPPLVGLLLLAGCAWLGAPEPPPGSAAVPSPWAAEPSPAVVVVANRGLRVPLGRSAWLDPARDLVLRVQPGDRCHLAVLDEDPLWQRPGRLSPRRFPCDFGPREVRYSHLGGRSPARDRVRLQLRYDSPSSALVLPLVLEVEVLFTQLEIVTRNLPLVVERLRGTSNPLDARSLEFTFEPGRQRCRVGLLPSLTGLPRYGEILNYPSALVASGEAVDGGPVPASMWDCEEFLRLGLRYRHTAAGSSPNRDLVPLVAELWEATGGGAPLKREYFQVLVRIRAGTENVAPKPSFLAMLMMEVDQFVLTALTPDMLAAEDAESPPDLLLFNITSPFGPGQGHMVSTDDRSLPVSSFSQRDVRELRIAYQPPVEDSDRERLFELELEVLDPEGAASEPFAFVIVVKPMNTLAPVVTRNTGLVLYEGQSRPLSGPGPSPNLVISDEDDLEQVRVSVVAGLRHGHLTLLEDTPASAAPRKHFTVAELAAGRVIYQHDGSESPLSDNLVLRLEDGGSRHHVEFLFPITLVPTDDQPPLLNANTGLAIAEGETVPITTRALSATDIDSQDAILLFTVEAGPTAGQLLLRQAQPPPGWEEEEEDEGFSWRRVSGVVGSSLIYEKPVREWLQQDIVEGRLYYHHFGPHRPGPGVVLDQFVFRVQDDNDPPNRSGPQTFVIRVHPVDRLAPELHSGSSLHLIVAEQQVTPLRRKHLCYTDQDSGDRELRYTVTQPPTDTDTNHPPDEHGARLGSLVLTEDHSVEVTHFTQAQINHHKISYRPPQEELGVAPHLIQFQYQVEDAAGNAAEGTFTIYLQPVDNQPPEITNTGFTLPEGGSHVLSPTELDASDTDTELAHLRFILTQAPRYGQLQLSGYSLILGGAFGLEDIRQGRVVYVHSGAETNSDTCRLDVSDGVHVVPITLKMNVHPVDDEVPTLRLPPGTVGSYLDVLENGAAEITANVIQGTDEDTDDLMLTFIVEDPPQHGNILVQGVPAERFSQRDLLDGAVVYAHTGGEIGLLPKEDTFNLTLSDLSEEWSIRGNVVQGVSVLVTILPVDNQAPEIFVGEQFRVVEGDKRVITTAHLRAEDVDTPTDDILCTIVAQPTSGYVENISPAPGSEKSRAGIAISAFTLKDLHQGHIFYVQSIHKGVEPVEDRFAFRCSDGISFSQRHIFPIVIMPMNDEEPEMFMREFVVMEGMSLVIDTPILNAVDGDIPADELTFTITRLPRHGHIVNQLANGTVLVESFTLDQITESSNILYEHDDSETKEDSFEVKLTDGKHTVVKTVFIMVVPVDDETPRMAINDGLEIEIGETRTIHNRILKATDLDSEDRTLTYIIRYGPGQGLLQRLKPSGGVENITLGMNFTQDEVDRNLIRYMHFGQEGVRDLIKFDVTDGINPLIDRYFYVTIGSIDIVFPDVISKGVSLKEGGKVTLTTDLLSTSDLNSPDENLVFTITRAPVRGHLECTDQPGVPISTFTQLLLAGNKIYYIHTSEDEVKMDSFEFEVTDGYNPVFRTFRISISDVDNKKPVVTIHNLVVNENEYKLITPFELTVEDRDTPDALLKFIITQIPVHGQIMFNNSKPVTTFTKQDLNENLISYRHDGTESVEDSFSFTVTDGTHTDFYVFPNTVFETRKPQTMKIRIMAVDNSVPQIVINKGAQTLRTLATGHVGFLITNKVLKAEDRDSLHVTLKIRITEGPRHGFLIHLGKGNHSISQFSQADIDDMKICYVLRAGDNATSDIFHFMVEDGGGNKLRNQHFRLNWAWISLEKAYYLVNEDSKYLDVVLKRRGYLGETSFISISTRDGTAKKDKDFRGKAQKQVQFNPGQTLATWRVRILSDGEHEQSESFQIVLSEPVMAVLEFPDVSTVEIIDPGDESTVFIPQSTYTIEEDVGELFIPVRRSGDVSQELMVICYTQQGTASGTAPTSVLSYSDYISRPEDHNSVLRFDKDEREKMCRVVIIDDSLYEEAETFDVLLSMPMGGRIGTEFASTRITIVPDKDDGGNKLRNQHFRLNWAWISLEKAYYLVNEDSKYLDVVLKRRGYLGETSFISISTRDGTAKKDKDFRGKAQKQVQFNPGQTLATWRVRILSDGEHEQSESFQIVLSEPVMAVLEFPDVSTVEIIDPGDESTVFIPQSTYTIEEDVGELFIPVRRSGDVSQELMVVCYTQQGTASGTAPTSVLSYSDYISRPEDHNSVLRFDKDEREKMCRVVIIDDSLYEEAETFDVLLSMPMGGRIGTEFASTRITIVPDKDDEPAFYFGNDEYYVDESAGYVEVRVWRTGTDLSKAASVTVRSRKSEPITAEAGVDYVGISRNLDFAPGVSMQTFRVVILDDLGQPVLEGTEKFELVLRMPMNAALGEPSKATIFINDSVSDLPKMQFKESLYVGNENDGQISAMIYRSGDIRYTSTVRCYTRQGSAQVMIDFEERPNTDSSIITFLPGETEKPCTLVLTDDTFHEEDEELRLVLGTPRSDSSFGASVGEQNETLIKIQDDADKAIIKFGETKFSVSEPKDTRQVAVVKIPVLRLGDTSKVSVVRVHTKDGSATSGEDYHPISEEIEFKEGETQHFVEIEVLYDGVREMREAFTVHLKPDENMVAEIQAAKAIVYIEEMNSMADVTFPSVPQVASLLIYDDTSRAKDRTSPVAGYPVICITACNPKYEDFDKTGSICASENINNTLTQYRWLVSAPTGPDGVTSPMKEVDFDTFFTSSKMITLDSIYFQAGSRVQCAARAVNSDGNEGLELMSPIVTISTSEGLCQPRMSGVVGAEPFSAKLRYTGPEDPAYANLIKLTVTMPHIDGMLPVISTRELSNFELTLSPDGTRVGNHKCSNLLDYTEVKTHHGFLTDATKNPDVIGDTIPYQYSPTIRGFNTLRFYRNLNLEACLWEFVSYYDMSELLTDCGGTIGTDGQVLNLVQSYVTLRVPLYVSYVFHSPVGVGGWQHFDLQSELRLTFVYDTAILWKDGIGSPPEAELQGSLYPTSMRISEEGRLVVNFKTEARFRGLFVMSHPASSLTSMVMSADHPGLTFSLSLIRSEPTYNQPVQQWSFVSDFAVRDYSGTYTVKLIACTTAPHQEYSLPVICNPREPITFDLDIRFQQVSDPVAAEFSLNTQMFLLSKKTLWLSDGSMGFGQESDVAFSEGDIIYGRVMVDPVQNLGDSFYCSIEKVFLCTGADGYVPKYNPSNTEYGCLADSPSLLYRFKIVDKAQPETQASSFGNVLFNAKLAIDDPEAISLVKQPGSDGFKVDSTPLFQVSLGREWYVHTIYTVRSKENANRGIGKRSVEHQYHSLFSGGGPAASTQRRQKRGVAGAPELAKDIGVENNRGTNIQHIALDRTSKKQVPQREVVVSGVLPRELNSQNSGVSIVTIVGGAAAIFLAICLIAIIVLLLKRRQNSEKKEAAKKSGSNEPMMLPDNYTSDSSEV